MTCGSAADTVRTTPMRLTSIVRTTTSTGLTATVLLLATPALATTTSMPPSADTAPSTAASTAAWSVTSASNQAWPGPSSPASAASRSGSRPTSAIRAPRRASASAVCSPMPRAAPVMRTALPARSYRLTVLLGSGGDVDERAQRARHLDQGVARGAADAGHVDEAVDQPVEAAQDDRHAGLTQRGGVGLALVAQRVERGRDHHRRRQAVELVVAERSGARVVGELRAEVVL